MVRVVSKADWKIHTLFVRLALCERSLNGRQLADFHISELKSLDFELKYWCAASMDRASVNKKAMRLVQTDECRPVRVPCLSHILALAGDKLEGPHVKAFLNSWKLMIAHNGKACALFKEQFKIRPQNGNSVSWGAQCVRYNCNNLHITFH